MASSPQPFSPLSIATFCPDEIPPELFAVPSNPSFKIPLSATDGPWKGAGDLMEMDGSGEAVPIDGFRGSHRTFEEILALDEVIRRRAERIAVLLLVEVVRAGPAGLECERIDREDPVPFRVDRDPMGTVSWHLTLTYAGPAGDALGSRGRWSQSGEVAAECVLDPLGLFEALASGRLSRFFSDLAPWLEAEVTPRGLATEDRIGEAAGMARDLARLLEGWRNRGEIRDHNEMTGDDADLRS